jgi:phosphoserine phosphatase
VARGPAAGIPEMVGLVTLYDPLRPDAQQLITALHDLGVPVKMLTGDALAVACEIGKGVGLPNIRRAADLKAASAQAGNKAVDLLAGADGLAEVYPEDKYLVVQHLQAAGHMVGMTGDGVNDAPALRQAEVGIAVSTATDVAKAAASVVLTGQGLTNIVALVEQGRIIYQRVLTWIINKISFSDGLRDDRSGHRPRSTVQEAGNVGYWGLQHGIHRARHRDGRRNALLLVDRLVTFRFGIGQQCSGHLQFPDAALFFRFFKRIAERTTLVLGDDA